MRLDPGSSFTAIQQGLDTVVDIVGGGRVVLAGVALSGLDANWIFVG